MDELSQEWIRSKGNIQWVKIVGPVNDIKPIQHYDRSKIREEPIKAREQAPIIDADTIQRDQLTTRLSLRRDK